MIGYLFLELLFPNSFSICLFCFLRHFLLFLCFLVFLIFLVLALLLLPLFLLLLIVDLGVLPRLDELNLILSGLLPLLLQHFPLHRGDVLTLEDGLLVQILFDSMALLLLNFLLRRVNLMLQLLQIQCFLLRFLLLH